LLAKSGRYAAKLSVRRPGCDLLKCKRAASTTARKPLQRDKLRIFSLLPLDVKRCVVARLTSLKLREHAV
jgi:hypothetical protein